MEVERKMVTRKNEMNVEVGSLLSLVRGCREARMILLVPDFEAEIIKVFFEHDAKESL